MVHRMESSFPRKVALAAGFGVGALWILMAASALISAIRGARLGRGDWALGWGLVGGILLLAGSAAIAGTWWHLNRVLTGATREHH